MRCPFATWRPISENVTRGGRRTIRGFVPHVQTNDGDLFNFFNTRKPPGEGGSADFQCFKDGRLQQFVDLVDQSWAQGSRQHNGNPYFVSCEFEGRVDEPMTPEQIDQGGRLIAWAWANTDPFPLAYNTDPDGQGITPHHVFGGGHTCPGPGPREGQFPDLIVAANRWLNPNPKPSPINLKELPMEFFALPDTGPHFYVNLSNGMVIAFHDGASKNNLIAAHAPPLPEVHLSDATWSEVFQACKEVRGG